MLDVELAAREHIHGSLVHQKRKRAAVHSHAARFADIYKLDVLVLIYFEFEALGHIVHLGGHNGIRAGKFEFGKHLKESSSLGETLGLLGVLAINLDHRVGILVTQS